MTSFPSILALAAALALVPAPGRAVPPGAQSDAFAKSGRVRLAAEARIKDDAFPEGILFRNPRFLAADARGDIYLADADANHIKVFSRGGKFLRLIGRAGQGPGELQMPSLIAVSGGRLAVWEAMGRRFSILGLDGTFIKTASPVHVEMGDLMDLHALPDGRFAALVERGFPANRLDKLPAERDYAVLILSAELAPLATLYESKMRNRTWTRHPQTKGLIQVGFPYHPAVRTAVSPDGTIAVATGQGYEIVLFDADKRRKAVIRRDYQPVRLENRDKEAHFALFKMRVLVDNQMALVNKAPDYIRQLTEFPELLPPFRGFFYDGRGRLWVQVTTPGREADVFDIFAPGGELLGRIRLEGAPIGPYFASNIEKVWTGDLLWQIEKDEDDFCTLVKYRLPPAAK